MFRSALLLSAAVLPLSAAIAQPAQETAPATDHLHDEQSDEIVVTANFVRSLDLLAGTASLTGTQLVRDMRPQIGDTLARLPGVSATSFSPGASRPVLRGFQGERIRVLTDGIGSIDVSSTSADHGVTIDPLTAQRIEVLHGPAVLLFGGQAIGGAVNVLDRRIPRRVPDEPIHIDGVASYGTAADERSAGVAADMPIGGGAVFHLDGSYRKSDDLRTGGYVLSPQLRAEQLDIAAEEDAEGNPEHAAEARALADLRGRIPDTQTETFTLGTGLALIRDGGNLGVSVSYYDSNYGVPTRPGAEHAHGEEEEIEAEHAEEGPVSIGMKQLRADVRGEVKVGGFLDAIRVRLGAADYEHIEFEGDEIGTIFDTQGLEGRLELVQADRGGWRGASGIQYFAREFDATGAEAFIPRNDTSQLGLFTLQEFNFGALGLQAAARYERSDVDAAEIGVSRAFDAFSAAAGLSYELAPRVKIGANVSRSERAPSAEELYSNGPHVATQAFEIGDATLATEKSWGVEAYVRAQTSGFTANLTVFANWFDDYIYQAATGEEEDGLPVFAYFQQPATYWGFELEASAPIAEVGGFKLVADAVADYVRADLDEAGPVPRIPPLRILGGIEAQSGAIDGRLEAEYVAEQDRVSAFETPTDGFTLVNASVAWRPWGRDNRTTLIASANNIFDVEARRHASFTKDFVPLAGRDFRLSARVSF